MFIEPSCLGRGDFEIDNEYNDIVQRKGTVFNANMGRKRQSAVVENSRRISNSLEWCSVYNLELTPDDLNQFGVVAGNVTVYI